MRVTLRVEVELTRESGKFTTKNEIEEALLAEIESADPGQIDGVGVDGDSVYTIESFDVSVVG